VNTPLLIAAAWPYANSEIHVGNLAGAYLPADILARYHRLRGRRVLFVSGSDAHGTPVTVRAEVEGVAPETIYQRYHHGFLDLAGKLGLSYDLFTSTHTENHFRVARTLFLALERNGCLTRGRQPQWYAPALGRFLPDRYVEGTCPHCGFDSARGDQCDGCGQLLEATALLQPRCTLDGQPPVRRETEHVFLDLARLQPAVEAFLTSRQARLRPNVLKQSLGQLRTQPLRARAITRDLDWGVPVPLSGWQGKCLYVWFEAVVGYLSATIEWASLNGTPAAWQDWWCDPAAESLYVIGKDNIPFHAIVWPAQIAGAADTFRVLFDGTPGSPLNLPSDIPANEFLNLEGRKISGSRNWAVWGLDVLNRYSPDALRYYLAANLPESRDTDWDWADFTTRVNGDLVGTWGNAVNRVLSLTWRHWVGRVPEPHRLGSADQELLTRIEAGFAAVGAQLDAVHLRAALAEAFGLAGDLNRYLAVQAPWAKVQPDREAAATTLWTALQGIATINTLLAPFLPHAAERLNGYLGQAGPIFGESATTAVDDALGRHTIRRYQAGEASGRWAPAAVPAGRQLRPFEHLFAKLPPDTAEVERQRRGSAQHEVRSPAAPR
jgi:methionyl-tRNA synthetase